MNKINVFKLIASITSQLESCCKDRTNAEQEAWWLIETLTNKSKTHLLSNAEITLCAIEQTQLTQWIADRVEHNKPLAYILGSVPFCNLEILVRPPILIPRPETEEWVSWLIALIKKEDVTKLTVLDLCCGSGCIGLAIAKEFPEAQVLGIDINPEAIKLSTENKNHNKIKNINFIQSDLFQALPRNFTCNLIVSNPPYLAKEEFDKLSSDVKDWEDYNALVAQNQGMDFYTKILAQAPKYIAPRLEPDVISMPQIVFEIGPAQKQIEIILQYHKLKKFILYKDMQRQNRWIGCWI
jgi:release factor glutamine methyltransferase